MAKHRSALTWLVLLAAAAAAAPAGATPAADAFERLRGLVGVWEGALPDGRRHRVTYRLSAGDTVLVETWTLAPDRESLTVYHLDGDALLATHYCPQGTQPRLQLTPSAGERLQFELRDGASLHDPQRAHQHSFWIELHGADAFARSETYVENGSTPAEIAESAGDPAVTYTRISAAAP